MLLVSSSAVRQEMNVFFPLSAANPCRCFFLLTICMQLSMWINGDWRVAESGWCQVINQHNECRWAWCRWSPHSWLCHPAGSLRFPLLPFNVWLHASTKLSLPWSILRLILAIFFSYFIPWTFSHTLQEKKKMCWRNFSSTPQFEFGCDVTNQSCPSNAGAALFSASWKADATLATALHRKTGNVQETQPPPYVQ